MEVNANPLSNNEWSHFSILFILWILMWSACFLMFLFWQLRTSYLFPHAYHTQESNFSLMTNFIPVSLPQLRALINHRSIIQLFIYLDKYHQLPAAILFLSLWLFYFTYLSTLQLNNFNQLVYFSQS
jgi:hypothetical protein